jgi:hypothetical protein
MDMLVEAPQTHRDAKKNVSALIMSLFRNAKPPAFSKALIRDGFCCVVTGNYERSMVESNKELEKMADDENKGLITTNCAHIFAESTNMNISGDNEGSSKVRLFSYFVLYHILIVGVASLCRFHVGRHGSVWLPTNPLRPQRQQDPLSRKRFNIRYWCTLFV